MRFLFTTFEGGGHVPAPMLAARALQTLGHDVLMVSDRCNASAARTKGLPFRPWRRAPDRGALGAASEGLSDWRTRWPPAVIRRICDDVATGPALAYAEDVLEIAADFRPDVIVSNELLFGAMMAAERLSIPLALLTANVWCYPTRDDVPPFGPGYPLANSWSGRARDTITRTLIRGFFDAGLADLNDARMHLDLASLQHTLDQLDVAERIVIGTAPAFDFGLEDPLSRFMHCGPLFDTPDWAEGSFEVPQNGRPNVLISFGTTFQNQRAVLARAMTAVQALQVNGIVTLGPAMTDADLPKIENVRVVAQASHDQIVPHCAAVICHGGHGTLLRPLAHGVPVVAMPMGRDHADNAARLEWLGAGARVPETASASRIRRALNRVLTKVEYRENAQVFASQVKDRDASANRAADLLSVLARKQQAVAA